MPDGVVGLREWTIVLPDAASVAEVGDRLRAAGLAAEARDGGLLARDPWGHAVLLASA